MPSNRSSVTYDIITHKTLSIEESNRNFTDTCTNKTQSFPTIEAIQLVKNEEFVTKEPINEFLDIPRWIPHLSEKITREEALARMYRLAEIRASSKCNNSSSMQRIPTDFYYM